MSVIRTRGCAAHVAVLAGALVLMLLLATSASAAPLAGSAYDSGDGNQDTQLSGDWQSAQAQGRVKISRDRNDDCFIGGVKELSPDGWAFNNSAGGCTPGKSNIRVAYVNPETLASTSYSHFAFFRNDTTGNTFLTFELNQTPTTWVNGTGTTIPCRSNGDILLSFEVGGSSLQSVLYRWTGDNSGPPSCPHGANGSFTGSGVIPGSRSQGTMNSAQAITNYIDPASFGASFPANSFGEAAIDIPAVLQAMGQSPCVAFLQMQVHSRSSSSITSAMIDYTEPVPVNIQSCAAIGEKYADVNANGARDAGENGLAGFEFYDDVDDDGVRDGSEPTGTSDASGFYRILDLAAGGHKIRELAKPGWRLSAPASGFYQRTLTTGGNSVGNDFGNVGPATATGTRFHDLDADGIRDAGEFGQAGWTYYADLDGNGVQGAGEPSGSSDAGGAWTIVNVPAGPQTIREVPQAGWTCSAPAGCAYARTFVSGATVAGLEFGGWAPASVGGNVFEDLDGDGGAFEGGDVGLATWQVYLDANANNVFDLGEIQTTTNAAGNYTLTGVAPGAHTVRVTGPPAGWYCTRPGATLAACERALTLTSGQLAGGQDFGFSRTATVSGTVFNDADNSGTRGGAEVAWTTATTIFADLNANGLPDAGEPSVATSTGIWTLAGVPAGTVAIRQTAGAFTCTTPAGCAFTPTLSSGQTVPGYQFGNYVATSKAISGTVWLDANENTVKDATETTGVAGITVYADNDDDGAFDAGEGTGVTNSAGAYVLTTTANGNVKVRIRADAIVPLLPYICSFPTPGCFNNVTGLGNGQSYSGRDFGVYGPASVSGRLVHDLNANGVQDAGETAGLAGRTIYDDIDNDSTFDATEPNITTAADGTYTLPGLNPGTHRIRMVLGASYTCSAPASCVHVVTMASAAISGLDFLNWTPAAITGTVFEDADADGAAREVGEAALANRTVYLDANNNAVKDIAEIAVLSNVNGAYTFAAVVPGSHTVRQLLPAGWVQDTPAGAHTVAAVSGALDSGRDFSSHTPATISGRVFNDADFQGDPFGAGDTGMAGRTVYLDANANGQLDGGESSVTTDGLGNYTLTVAPGSYSVRTVPANADRACAFPSGCAYAINATSGSSYGGRDFGSYVGATVSGTVFEDADADGQAREAGEPPAPGRRVYLDANANGVREASEPTMLTAADGSYSFHGVTAQSWAVRLDLGGGWTCDSPSAPCAHPVVLTSGATQSGRDFGVHTTATISGHLYTDRDNDGGPQLFGENDQPGRTVYLDNDASGTLNGGDTQTVTDDFGDYSFAGLQPGTYRVRHVLPAGWQPSVPAGGLRTVTVLSGETKAAQNFSSWTTADISGRVFEDSDADGDFPEAGEPGLSPRTVYLDTTPNGSFDSGEPTAVTGAGGSFTFAGLAPGAYTVRPVVPAAWSCSYPASCSAQLVLEAGELAQDIHFGLWTNATLAGTVYSDTNGDGDRDAGEGPLANRLVFVDLDGDTNPGLGEPSQPTAADGAYAFGLRPGTSYTVIEVPTAGWVCTTGSCTLTASVSSGQVLGTLDFGNQQNSATVSGRVAIDADGSGTAAAGEPPLAGWTVFADIDGDGAAGSGEAVATTAPDGTYVLDNVPQGTRTIRVSAPAGWTCSSPCSRSIPLAPGSTTADVDFALYQPPSISGRVYEDDDADATRDGGDGGLGGRLVYIDVNTNGTYDATEPTRTTDGSGDYAFTGLAPGTFTVRAAPEPGWVCTDCAATRTLSSGQDAGEDFGRYQPITIAGTIYEDANANGTKDAGEPGISGRQLFFDADDDASAGAGEATAVSGAGGTYVLTGIAPGSGRIRGSLPAGFVRTQPVLNGYLQTVSSSDALTGRDFGGYRVGSIAGHTANDLNGNGVDDPGEPGKAGWTMYLDADNDGVLDTGELTALTDSAGDYRFDNLVPATYRVRPAITAGFTCTKPSQCVYVNAIVSGEDATARDFALVEAARVSGAVYADLDADGVRDGADGGRPGRIVWVDYNNDGAVDPAEPFATTDAAGNYTIVGVSPGQFRVRYDAPAGEHISDPAAGHHVVTFASGDVVLGKDFGSYVDAVISGAVYDDMDNSGDRQAGENGLSNKTVQLDAGADGSVQDTTTTDVNGAYTFTGRTPGSYRVTVVIGAGNDCTAPDQCRWDRTVSSGATSTGNDFAIYRVPVADLSLTKSAPAMIDQNETFDYTLVVTNNGPDAAQSVSIADTLPAGVQFVDASPGCAYAAPTVTCTVGTIANGASATRTITVEAIDAGAIENSATVSSLTGDPTPANDSDDADVTVAPVADLRMVKTGPVTVAAGALATYTVTAHNDGPSTADGVVLRDLIPDGMTFDASSDAGWTLVSPGIYENAVGSIANGGSTSRDIVLRARHAAADSTQTNTARVLATTTDNTPGNDSDAAITDVGPSANLAITKTIDDATIAQGADAVYTLTLTNNGPSAAANVTVLDALPAGMRFVSLAAPASFDCTTPAVGSGGSVTCSIAALPNASVVTFTLTVRATTTGTRVNTAGVTSTTPDADPADNGASVSAEVAPTADVSITKTAPDTVVAGENVTYAITVSNDGPSTAHDVVVSDPLPTGMTFDHVTSPMGTSCTGGATIACTIATLADGASVELSIGAVATFAAAEQTLTNIATVSADEFDPETEGNQSSAETVVGPAPDLRLTKTASVPAALQNSQLTYTLTAFNDGPSAATNVTVTDTLPSGMSFVSGSNGCTDNAGTVTCELGNIAIGSNAVATITVLANGNGTQVNNATVASDDPDPDPSDDAASATVEVGPVADLSIVKTSSPSVTAGGQLTYTLTAHNAGPSPATGVTVVDVLPSGMTYAGSTSSQGSCAFAAGTVTCALGGLANGASATATITVTASFALSGTTVPNSASISGDQNDDGPANNASTRSVDVGPAADLVLTDDAPAHVPAGGQLLHSLQLSNGGPQTAVNSKFTVTLPAGLTFVSAIPTQGNCSAAGQIVTCIVGDLPAGSAMQVLLAVLAADVLGSSDVDVSGVASSDTTEIDEPSNRDGATTRVDPAPVLPPPDSGAAAPAAAAQAPGDLRITKTADSGAKAALGRAIAYTISVTNAADHVAHGVVVADQPSAAVSIGSVRPDRGTCSGLTCSLGDLGAGEVVRIHVVMTPKTTGTFENAAVASSDDGERAVADNRAVAAVSIASARTTLSLKKTVDRKVVRAGSTVWFTITARNTGRASASDVRVCDRPAYNTTFVTVRGARFTRGRACWTTPSLKAGARLRYRVKVRVSGTERARAMTDATVTASNADSRRARKGVRVIARQVLAGAGVTG
jgi:uncharacterized repeat protein (TIGR01451 family)